MRPDVLQVLALLLTALAMIPSGAHLLELSNKIRLTRGEYQTAQKLYRGWQFAGIIVIGALLSTLALTLRLRSEPESFTAAAVAFACIAGTQVIFWSATFPVNRRTVNWTMLPDNWAQLRIRWEYSHAASAVLNLIAFISVSLAVVTARN
jgi:hypothetical protein